MIICISGLSGSGKNSVGTMLSQKLGLRIIDPTFKTIAAKQKMDLMDFHKKAEHDHSIDKHFDEMLIADANRGNCVVTTWLGPWMIKNADMRIWLYAPKAARAARVARRDGMSVEEAERHIDDRDESNRLRYLDIYKIDIYDHSGFDLIINSEKFVPSQSAEIIATAVLHKAAALRSKTASIVAASPAGGRAYPMKTAQAQKPSAKPSAKKAPAKKVANGKFPQKLSGIRKSGRSSESNKKVSKKRK